jgi:hypothetical protein
LKMDRVHEGDETRELNPIMWLLFRLNPTEKSLGIMTLFKWWNIVERLFRRLKEYRKICARYDKLDETYWTYIYWRSAVVALRCVNRGW